MDISKLVSLSANSALSDTLSAVYDDCQDTFSKATAMVDVLSSLYEGLLSGEMNETEFNDFCLTNMPMQVSISKTGNTTSCGYITWDGLDGSIVLKAASTDNPVIAVLANYSPSGYGTVLFSNVLDFDAVVQGWSLRRIGSALSSSLNCASIIMDAVTVLSSQEGNFLSAFKDRVNAYSDKLVGDSRSLYSDLCDAFGSLGTSKIAACSYLIKLYQNLSSCSGDDTDGTLSFSQRDYYVEGFFGAFAIKTVLSVVTAIASKILAFIGPAVGAIAYVASGICNFFLEMTTEATWAKTNHNVLNHDFVVPIFQGYQRRIDIRTNYADNDYVLAWLNKLEEAGYLSVRYPGCHAMCWIDDTYVYLEAFVSCDVMTGTSSEINYNDSLFSLSVTGASLINDMVVSDSNAFKAIRSHWATECGLCNFTLGDYAGVDSADADIARLSAVTGSTFILLSSILSSKLIYHPEYSITSTTVHPTDYTVNEHTDIGDQLYFLSWGLTHNGTFMDWKWITESIIPNCRAYLEDVMTVVDVLYPAFRLQQYYDNDIAQEANKYYNFTIISNNLGDYSSPYLTPPRYSKSAFMNTVLIGIAASAVIAGVGIAAFKVRRKIQLWAHRKQLDLEAKRYAYEDDPSDENWNAYVSSLKRYNWSTILTGYSKLSYVTGYEVDSSDDLATNIASDAKYSQAADFTELTNKVRPW